MPFAKSRRTRASSCCFDEEAHDISDSPGSDALIRRSASSSRLTEPFSLKVAFDNLAMNPGSSIESIPGKFLLQDVSALFPVPSKMTLFIIIACKNSQASFWMRSNSQMFLAHISAMPRQWQHICNRPIYLYIMIIVGVFNLSDVRLECKYLTHWRLVPSILGLGSMWIVCCRKMKSFACAWWFIGLSSNRSNLFFL